MNKEVEEMMLTIPQKIVAYDGNPAGQHLYGEQRQEIAEVLYNAGYRKIDEFAKCRDCTAWSGTDCTRHPYTQGCLKDENNIKWQAVKEFAEWIKDNITDIPFCNQKAYNVFCDMVNEKLKEYEK